MQSHRRRDPPALLASILEFAAQRGLFVIMDECYDRYIYGRAQYATLPHVDFDPKLPFFIAGSFSKTFSMTGTASATPSARRMGSPRPGKFQSHSMNGVTTFAQFGGLAALQNEEALFAPVLQLYARRQGCHPGELARVPGLVVTEPDGAFYTFPEATGLMDRLGAKSSDRLAERLLKESGVMVIPGGALGSEGFLRVSFAVPEEQIREAAQRIRAFVDRV